MNNNGNLSILCYGDICQRINTLIGGTFIAQQLDYDYDIIWPVDERCGFAFNDIFTNNDIIIRNTKRENYDVQITPYKSDSKYTYIKPKKNDPMLQLQANIQDKTLTRFVKDPGYPRITERFFDLEKHKIYKNILYTTPFLPSKITTYDCINILKSYKLKPFIVQETIQYITQNNIDMDIKGIYFNSNKKLNTVNKEKVLEINNCQQRYYICSDIKEIEDKFKNSSNHNVLIRKKKYAKYDVYDVFNNIVNTCMNKEAAIDVIKDVLIMSRTAVQNNLIYEPSLFLNLVYWYQDLALGKKINNKIVLSQII